MTRSHADLMDAAETLADRLWSARPRVNRTVLLSMVSAFLQRRDLDELRRTLELARRAGGHRRGEGQFSGALDGLVKTLLADLASTELSSDDYARLLGWVARLLYAWEKLGSPRANRTKVQDPRKGENKGPTARGGLGQKNLSALEQIKQRLEGKKETQR